MSWAERFAEGMARAVSERDARGAQQFEFGDVVQILPGGKTAWTVIHQGLMAVKLHSADGAWRSELPSNLEPWKGEGD